MMIYEKTLSRKNIFGVQVDEKQDGAHGQQNGFANGEGGGRDIESRSPKKRRLCGVIPWRQTDDDDDDNPKEAASIGKIFNLLRGDAYEVAQRFWEVDSLIDKPLGLLIAIILVWKLFGPSCFLGILAVFLGQGLNAILTRTLFRWERIRRAATDARLQISSQFCGSPTPSALVRVAGPLAEASHGSATIRVEPADRDQPVDDCHSVRQHLCQWCVSGAGVVCIYAASRESAAG